MANVNTYIPLHSKGSDLPADLAAALAANGVSVAPGDEYAVLHIPGGNTVDAVEKAAAFVASDMPVFQQLANSKSWAQRFVLGTRIMTDAMAEFAS